MKNRKQVKTSFIRELKMLLVFTALTLTQSTFNISDAKAQSWQWAKQMGGNIGGSNPEDSREEVVGMEVDKRGNSYVLFRTYSDLLNPNKIQVDGTDLGKKFGNKDMVLASFDCSGKLRWGKVFGGPSTDIPFKVKIDTLGGVYITGVFTRTPDDSVMIDDDTILRAPTAYPYVDYKQFTVIKYDSSGNYKWLRRPEPDTLGGYGRNSAAIDMDVSPNGKVSLLTMLGTRGAFASGSYIVSSSTALPSMHMLQYDANGNFIKGVPMGMSGTSVVSMGCLRMAWDYKNDVYYVGAIKVLGEPALTFGSTVQTGSNLLAKYNNTGSNIWVKQSTTSGVLATPNRPILDVDGNIYLSLTEDVGGKFNGFSVVNLYTTAAQIPVFIKLNSSGTNQWGINVNANIGASGIGGAWARTDKVALFCAGNGEMSVGVDKTFGGGTSMGVIQLIVNTNTGVVESFDTIRGNHLANPNVFCSDAHGNFYSAYSYDVNLKVGSSTLGKYGGLTDIGFVKFGEASCAPVPGSAISERTLSNVKIYPNPASEKITVEGLQSSAEVHLFNIMGQQVKSLVGSQSSKMDIDISGLANGMYLLQVKTAEGASYSSKIVKQ